MKTHMNKVFGGLAAGAAALALTACLLPVGNGVNLTEDGTEIPPTPPGPVDTNLTFVFNNVISNSSCTGCHQGSAPDGQINLSSIAQMRAAMATINGTDTTWNLTTRLQDVQPRFRVLPFEPDSSMIYNILSDDPKGDYPRMPRFNPNPLSNTKITIVRRWIELGASLQ